MAASVQCRSIGMVMKGVDNDVEFSLNLWSRENETCQIFLQEPNDFGDQYGSRQENSLTQSITSALPILNSGADDFLSSESDKPDYEWLLTSSGKPIFPSMETQTEELATGEFGISGIHHAVPECGLANLPVEPAPSKNTSSQKPVLSTDSNASMAANKRQCSTVGLKSAASRSATPTGRSTLPAKTKPSRASTPTSRATLPTTAKPRASTPTSRATQPSTKPAVRSSTPTRPMPRSSTPTRPMPRSSTPTARPSVPAACKPTSRSTTPTLKNRVAKAGPTIVKTSLPERPVSASRSRPVASSTARSSSRGRGSNGSAYINGIRVVGMSRADSTCNDDVSPVEMGNKMVERVVNMRKLAPPKLDGCISKKNNSSENSMPSQEKSGFGRMLSRSSLDMALRHMDIRRSIPGNLRPVAINTPESSVSSVVSGSSKSRTTWDSPLETSSNASSEPSFNNIFNCLDEREVEDTNIGNVIGHSNV